MKEGLQILKTRLQIKWKAVLTDTETEKNMGEGVHSGHGLEFLDSIGMSPRLH
jgi:hypothetical protein